MPMIPIALPVLLAALLTGAEQPDSGKPADAKPAEAAAPAKAAFPAPVKKNLYANNDLRGKAAPKFEVEKWLAPKSTGGAGEVKAADTKGKVVLIDFWATWCPPCRAAIPELNKWQKTFKDDLVIIGVSDEEAKKVQPFLDKTPIDYAMAIDTKARMKNAVGVQGIPNVLVIGTDNIVRWQGFPGSQEEHLSEATLRQIIEADKARRASEKKVDPATPPPSTPAPSTPAEPAPRK